MEDRLNTGAFNICWFQQTINDDVNNINNDIIDKQNIMFKLPSVEMILAQQGIKLDENNKLWRDKEPSYKDCYEQTLEDI